MAEAQEVEPAAVDYFGDPERRAELFERDGWRCRYCGETVTASTATLDHMVPQSKGGPNTPENLATCCLMCNSIKSGRPYEESAPAILEQLGRASCRARVCQYVSISVGAVRLKNKNKTNQ